MQIIKQCRSLSSADHWAVPIIKQCRSLSSYSGVKFFNIFSLAAVLRLTFLKIARKVAFNSFCACSVWRYKLFVTSLHLKGSRGKPERFIESVEFSNYYCCCIRVVVRASADVSSEVYLWLLCRQPWIIILLYIEKSSCLHRIQTFAWNRPAPTAARGQNFAAGDVWN